MLVFRKHLHPYFSGDMIARGMILPSKLLTYFFASSKITSKGQKALISYFMFNFISHFEPKSYSLDNRSIRERLLDRKQFISFIFNRIQKYELPQGVFKTSITQEWIAQQLQEKNYWQVAQAFKINKGMLYDPRIWQQNRLPAAQRCLNRMVLSPNYITSQYFFHLFPSKNSILSGEKGSFSFLIYDYLTGFINDCKINEPTFVTERNGILPREQLQFTEKICYINLKEDNLYSQYFKQIAIQFKQIIPEQEVNRRWNITGCSQEKVRKIIIQFLNQIQSKYQQSGIQIIGVIDQANRIFRLLKNLQTIIDEQQKITQKDQILFHEKIQGIKWRQSKEYKTLLFLGDLLEILTSKTGSKFSRIIMNSSQDFEYKILDILSPEIKKQLKIVDILCNWRIFDKSTSYTPMSSIKMPHHLRQIQLYNCFWFQIMHLLQNRNLADINNDLQEFSKQKKIFFQAFKVGDSYQTWKNDTRLFEIRVYFSKLKGLSEPNRLLKSQGNLLLKDQWTSDEKEIFINEIRDIKQNIQRMRLDNIVQNLITYFKKVTSYSEFREKQSFVTCIESEAKYKQKLGQQGPIFKYQATTIPKDKRAQFISAIGFGYNHANSYFQKSGQQSYLTFSSNPATIIKIISAAKLSIDYAKLNFQYILNLLTTKRGIDRNNIYGNMLDSLSYHYLARNKLSIQIKQYLNIGLPLNGENEQLGQFQSYSISSSVPFRGFTKIVDQYSKKVNNQNDLLDPQDQEMQDQFPISQKDLKNQFSKLVSLANKIFQKGEKQYLGCYPAIFNQDNEMIDICGNQRTFDCMILRMTHSNTLQINFFDWTMGKITSKQMNYLKQAKKLLSYIPFGGKIECKILMVAPQYHVKSYLQEIAKQKNGVKCNSFKASKICENVQDLPIHKNGHNLGLNEQKIIGHAEKEAQSVQVLFGFASFDRKIIFSLDRQSKDHSIMTNIMGKIYDIQEQNISLGMKHK